MPDLATPLTRSLRALQIAEAARAAATKMAACKAVDAILRAYEDEDRNFCPGCGQGAPGFIDDPKRDYTLTMMDDPMAGGVPCPVCRGEER